jgi:hypothetical protein
VHILLEEVGAAVASVSVKDTEIAATRPSAFVIGLGDVHNDGNSIFVVVLD